MTVYIVLIIVLCGIALFSGLFEQARKWGLPTIMVVLFFLMAFRARTVGTDTNSYVWLFTSHGMAFSSLGEMWSSRGDITALYDSYAWVIYQLVPFEQSILICNSFIICLGVYLFIREFSETEVFSALLYVLSFCYFFAFNGMRQSVAAAIVLMALVCMRREKYVSEVLLLIIALGIHQTSLFMVPVVIAAHILNNSQHFGAAWILFACLAAAFSIRILYAPLFEVFSGLFSHFGMYAEGASPFSITDTTQGRQAFLYIVIALFMLMSVCVPGVSQTIAIHKERRTLWLMASLCVGFGVFCTNYELLARLIYYVLPALACILGTLSKQLDVGNKTVLVRMGLLACYLVLCLYMLYANYGNVVPYTFFWK